MPDKLSRASKGSNHATDAGGDGRRKATVFQLRAGPTFIDLFCGCGGFSLGMIRAGFQCLAAIDLDATATETFRTNLSAGHVLTEDLTKFGPRKLAKMLATTQVDVLVGGPPCQGFSTARQVDGANHGKRLKRDSRRRLYQEFLKYVEYFQPRVFVIENVLGIRNAAGGEYFTRVHHEARILGQSKGLPGYRVHSQIEDAYALGVPQKRRRQLIIGVRADLPQHFVPELHPPRRAMKGTNLGHAIGDLPIVRANGGVYLRDYDAGRREQHILENPIAENYLYNVLEIRRAPSLTAHVARPQSDRDLRDFARLREGESSTVAMRDRHVKFEFPYDKTCFKDRYTRQSRTAPCSTIVAHMCKDGLMFIHPTQNRSLTVREAARVQSFPDWFSLPESRTRAFRLVGNAVPPLVAEAVGNAIAGFFKASADSGEIDRSAGSLRRRRQIASSLEDVAGLTRSQLRSASNRTLVKAWQSLFLLFPDLHPDNARDHGSSTFASSDLATLFPGGPERLKRRYQRSGWPVMFEELGREMCRRKERGKIPSASFYNPLLLATGSKSGRGI